MQPYLQATEFFPDFKNYLSNPTATGCVRELLAADGKGRLLYKFIKKAAENTSWLANSTATHLIERAIELLQSRKISRKYFKKASDKLKPLKEQLTAIQTEHAETPQVSRSGLFTTVIRNPFNMITLESTMKRWFELVKEKEKALDALPSKPKDKKKILVDSYSVLRQFRKEIWKLKRDERLYVAYDKNRKIQGAAIVDAYKNPYDLFLLATSPENIQIRETDRAIRGVGTALLLHIAHDMRKKKIETLEVTSYPSAISFYNKISFEAVGPEKDEKTPMEITSQKLETFIQANTNFSLRTKREPALRG